MEPISSPQLDQISTAWTRVVQARDGTTNSADAYRFLLDRYFRPVKRYLLGALRDQELADELAQEFALRFVRGDLKGADQARGRFRDFVKGVLIHLIADHHRRSRSRPLPLEGEPAAPDQSDADQEFLQGWRDELLRNVWRAMSELRGQGGNTYYTVLRFRADNPGMRSDGMAERLSAILGKTVTAAWVRQTLHRAREQFASCLVDEVAQTLDDSRPEKVKQELIDLGLLEYCRPVLGGPRQSS